MSDLIRELLVNDSALAEPIKETTALAASLAAVSVAIFVVLPTFHSIIRLQGAPGFSEYAAARRIMRGLHTLALASCLFSTVVIVGIAGRHFPCRLLLHFSEGVTIAATMLFFVAIYVIWRSTLRSFDDPGATNRRGG